MLVYSVSPLQKYHSDNTLRSVLLLSFLHCRIFWEHHFNNQSINSAAAVQQAFRIKYGPGQCVACVWCAEKSYGFTQNCWWFINADCKLLHRLSFWCCQPVKMGFHMQMHTYTLFFYFCQPISVVGPSVCWQHSEATAGLPAVSLLSVNEEIVNYLQQQTVCAERSRWLH